MGWGFSEHSENATKPRERCGLLLGWAWVGRVGFVPGSLFGKKNTHKREEQKSKHCLACRILLEKNPTYPTQRAQESLGRLFRGVGFVSRTPPECHPTPPGLSFGVPVRWFVVRRAWCWRSALAVCSARCRARSPFRWPPRAFRSVSHPPACPRARGSGENAGDHRGSAERTQRNPGHWAATNATQSQRPSRGGSWLCLLFGFGVVLLACPFPCVGGASRCASCWGASVWACFAKHNMEECDGGRR